MGGKVVAVYGNAVGGGGERGNHGESLPDHGYRGSEGARGDVEREAGNLSLCGG